MYPRMFEPAHISAGSTLTARQAHWAAPSLMLCALCADRRGTQLCLRPQTPAAQWPWMHPHVVPGTVQDLHGSPRWWCSHQRSAAHGVERGAGKHSMARWQTAAVPPVHAPVWPLQADSSTLSFVCSGLSFSWQRQRCLCASSSSAQQCAPVA